MEVMRNVGQLVLQYRKERGLSQESVAYSVGVEQTYISKVERGAKLPTPIRARAIARALELDEEVFFSDEAAQ